jgi:hypothetical protein
MGKGGAEAESGEQQRYQACKINDHFPACTHVIGSLTYNFGDGQVFQKKRDYAALANLTECC